ncbi:MAG: hypothetical protein ACLFP8_06760 [Alphaproteobacteria bacterium]
MFIKHTAKVFFLSAMAAPVFFISSQASAQLNEQPYRFKAQNRASIAALMKDVENRDRRSTTVTAAAIPSTTLVCGGDSADASAAGNTSCVIVNNSTGNISVGQDNLGNQDADSETTETTNVDETINVEEVLATLDGENDQGSAQSLDNLVN